MDFWDAPPVQVGLRIDTDPEADEGDTYSRAFKNPRLVRPGIVDRRRLRDAVQHLPARPAPDGLRSDKPGTLEPPVAHPLPGFREPVCDKVSFRGSAPGESSEQTIHIGIPKYLAKFRPTEERRIADDHICVGPLAVVAALRYQCIRTDDTVQFVEDRSAREPQAFAQLPLQFGYPYC